MQADEAIEERDLRRLPRRLFERLLRIRVCPILVVAFDRKIHVKAVAIMSAQEQYPIGMVRGS